ncbi:MAG: diguanylate cyclase domain-containing protein [Sphingobium sp.]
MTDESYRLKVLDDLDLLDTEPEPAFDALANLASRITAAPIAMLSLIDAERQWFKARCGFEGSETSRDVAFCSHAICQPDIMIVQDAREDARFHDNPLVTAEGGIVFYAGVPLLVHPREAGVPAAIGTLCVIDTVPRVLSDDQIEALRELAKVAVTLIEGRRLALQAVSLARHQQVMTYQLSYEQRKFQQAERMAALGYWRLNLADDQLHWSDQVYAIHGLPVSHAPPLTGVYEFYPPHARAEIEEAVRLISETGEAFDIETDFFTAQGALRRVRSIGELEVADGQPVAIFGVFQDVTERYWLEQGLRRSAHRDALTGLANRAALDEELEARIAKARAGDSGFAVMLIDLDGFKAVNDVHGHIAGDELLQVLAGRLQSAFYADCFVARLGGDEFVVIPDGSHDTPDLEQRAQQLLHDLSVPVVTSECEAAISGTIGITWLYGEDTRRDVMRRADQALYAAKNSERGTARIYRSSRVIHRQDADIRKAG